MALPLIMLAASLCVATVSDGATVRLCSGEEVRLTNMEAPAVKGSPRCETQQRLRSAQSRKPAWCDYRRGEASRNALDALLASGSVVIERKGKDQDGLTLAHIYVNDRDAWYYLISLGLARRQR